MLARYIAAVWKLRGANTLETEQPSVTLASCAEPRVTATVTADPEPHFCHIDKAGALATQLLKGLFAPDKEGSPEERIAAEIEAAKARRAKQTGTGVFLVVEGQREIPRLSSRRGGIRTSLRCASMPSTKRRLGRPFVPSCTRFSRPWA